MANRRRKVKAVTDFSFLGSKITVDRDCSNEIKRCLLFGRKTMTKLDSRGIILLIKFLIVKAMIFTVIIHGYESWTIKKSECQRIDAFGLWCWRRPESHLNSKEIKWVNPKGINPEYSLEGLMLKVKFQYFGHLMQRTDSLEKTLMLGRIEGRMRRGNSGWEGWIASLTQHEFEQTGRDSGRQRSLVCCSSWGHKELYLT